MKSLYCNFTLRLKITQAFFTPALTKPVSSFCLLLHAQLHALLHALSTRAFALCAALLVLCMASFEATAQSSNSDQQAQLKNLKRAISSLEIKLQNQNQEKNALHNQLKAIELNSSTLNSRVRQLNQQISGTESELSTLDKSRAQLESRINEQSSAIAEQIRAAHKMGDGEPIKLLLNQQDPQQLARIFKYYDYVLKARLQKIEQFKSDIKALTVLVETINQKKISLAKKKKNLDAERLLLAKNLDNRTAKLRQLESSLQSSEQKLNTLKRQRSELEQVISTVKSAAADLARPDNYRSFASSKGEILWPLRGSLLQKYGNKRTRDIRWEGWLIKADEGSSVQAVHQGRVVFSNYLRGFGLLIIIDHSDGYMSLYAHNQELLRDTGDSVERGEIISRAGNTGGLSDPAVYFEIRKDGQPVNPKSWLQSARSL